MLGRWKSWLMLASLLAAGSAAAGCGGGDGTADQGPRDMGTDSGSDGSVPDGGQDAGGVTVLACQRADIFISAIDMAAGTVTFTNPTGTDIALQDRTYQFCQGPGRYGAPPFGTVPAGGSLEVSVPNIITLNPVSGSLGLYANESYGSRAAMIHYVCWGDGGGTPRIDIARQAGSDGSVLWDEGGCVDLNGATSLFLRNSAAGNKAGDYSDTEVVFDCTPEPPDAGVDSGTTDAGQDAGPVSLLECDRDHLVIERVDLGNNEITLYNPTDTAIVTNGDYQLAHDLGFEAVPATTVAAYGSVTFEAPGIIELGDNQTLALYTTASFGTRDSMADYMCWGTGGTRPFLSVARTVGTDGTALWDDGGCTTASGNAIIHRLASREGNTAGDYVIIEPSESLDCSPITE